MTLYPVETGNFKLDGGAMFGVVPKVLWTRTNPADENNLIDIAVYATMAMNRFKRGDADPQVLEDLCKKVRSKSIKTRRLVNQYTETAGQSGNKTD